MRQHTTEFLVGTKALIRYINEWAAKKGFWDRTIPLNDAAEVDEKTSKQLELLTKSQKLMLIVSELGELLEGLRKPTDSKIPGYTNEEEELADAVIRCYDYAGQYELRLAECIVDKMLYNEGRPPKHGKNF